MRRNHLDARIARILRLTYYKGGGLVGGVAAIVGDPVTAMATVIPVMGVVAILSWLYWRTLPEPTIPAPRYQDPRP